MGSRVVVVVVVACLSFGAGALAYSWFGADDDEGQPSTGPGQPVTAPPSNVPPANGSVVKPGRTADAPVKKLKLPDGSEVAPLNGVTEPAVFTWGERPYSPILGTEHGNGFDWYVHADGTYSTTIMVWRPELGRLDPVTLIYPAGIAKPVGIGR